MASEAARPIDRFRQAITLKLSDDAMLLALEGMTTDDLIAFAGTAVGYVTNLLGLLAGLMEREPSEVWEWLRRQEVEMEINS